MDARCEKRDRLATFLLITLNRIYNNWLYVVCEASTDASIIYIILLRVKGPMG